MATKIELTGREEAFRAAARRFPEAELAIRRLMGRNENFCDMCDELAEAEHALARVPQMAAELSHERQQEWQGLIERLIAEIGEALRDCEGWKPGKRE